MISMEEVKKCLQPHVGNHKENGKDPKLEENSMSFDTFEEFIEQL